MKKLFKILFFIFIALVVIILINSIRNIYLITKALNLQFENTYSSSKTVNITISLNGELSSAQQSIKDIALTDRKISYKDLLSNYNLLHFKDIIFQIISLKQNCYRIKIGDLYAYIDRDTGYRIKDEIPKMNAYITYTYSEKTEE